MADRKTLVRFLIKRVHLDGVTEAELSLEKFRGSWCRLTVVDAQGRGAWSNPIWLDG